MEGHSIAHAIVLIHGHPDPNPGHLSRALGDSYAESARAAGHAVHEIDVTRLDFPILRNEAEYSGSLPPSLEPIFARLHKADHIVVSFPLWLGTLPALTKAFFEQLLHRNIAFEEAARQTRFPKGRLAGRSARLVVTHGQC